LIQEWHRYLDAKFERAIAELLKKRSPPKIRAISVDIKDIDWSKLSSVRESFTQQATEWFSRRGYDDKIEISGKLYAFASRDKVRARMRMHVWVRNIFQHKQGLVRRDDLRRLRLEAVELRDEAGVPKSFKEGQRLTLSRKDIDDLVRLVQEHSVDLERPTMDVETPE